MNIKQLRELIKDLPDELPVEVNIVPEGCYYDEDVSAFIYKDYACVERSLIITVGDLE